MTGAAAGEASHTATFASEALLLATLAEQEQHLPKYVCQEFEDYLKCGRLEYGFLRLRCEACHTEKLVAFNSKRRGFCPSCGALSRWRWDWEGTMRGF